MSMTPDKIIAANAAREAADTADAAREEDNAINNDAKMSADLADEGVGAGVIEAPGIVRDAFSNKTWTLPTNALQDAGLATYKSPRDIKKDPKFHYQFIRYDEDHNELPEYLARDFVPVTRKELGFGEFSNPAGQPSPLDSFYTIDGKDICVKI